MDHSRDGKTLDPAVIRIAIAAIDERSFEAFGQIILSKVRGAEVEPTGGVHDGGQDGFIRERKGRPKSYIQISKESDVRSKIKKTIRRLREGGRTVESLIYLTSLSFPTRDEYEDQVQREFDVDLTIHDLSWIVSRLQSDEQLSDLLAERAASAVNSAYKVIDATVENHTIAERISVIAFMDAHARSVEGQTDLLSNMVDATIYKALEGTDPDRGLFRSRAEVISFVEQHVPAIRNRPALDIGVRLERLSEKSNNPRIRWYRQEDKFCLPFDVRNELSEENVAVRRLQEDFLASIRARVVAAIAEASGIEKELLASAAFSTVLKTFERQGMNLAASFGSEQEYIDVRTYEIIAESVGAGRIGDNSRRDDYIECIERVIRGVIYSPTASEHLYLVSLFKMFSVEFVLRGDDRVASYFHTLVRRLQLYVGADIIIRALSETCLSPNARSTQNALSLLRKAGSTLLLTEQVLSEVYTHIIAENKEFENQYAPWFNQATPEAGRNSDRILIRAFFYQHFEPERHAASARSWRDFLGLIGVAKWFDSRDDADAFGTFLMRRFGFNFVPASEIERSIAVSQIRDLARAIQNERQGETFGKLQVDLLAKNDALMALWVIESRRRNGEVSNASVYGFSSWWLTEESRVVQAAKRIRVPHNFALHPQFLIGIIAVSPGLNGISQEASEFFPTTFGLRITNRVSQRVLQNFLRQAAETAQQDPAIAEARIRALSNELRAVRYE